MKNTLSFNRAVYCTLSNRRENPSTSPPLLLENKAGRGTSNIGEELCLSRSIVVLISSLT